MVDYKIEFEEKHFSGFAVVGDEDPLYILSQWIKEEINKAVFDMLKTPPNKLTICRGPEICI